VVAREAIDARDLGLAPRCACGWEHLDLAPIVLVQEQLARGTRTPKHPIEQSPHHRRAAVISP
jgi:hypothetical protein